jgi:hypothetical protein
LPHGADSGTIVNRNETFDRNNTLPREKVKERTDDKGFRPVSWAIEAKANSRFT